MFESWGWENGVYVMENGYHLLCSSSSMDFHVYLEEKKETMQLIKNKLKYANILTSKEFIVICRNNE